VRIFRAKQNDAGTRADVFLASKFPNFTRSSLERLFDKKLVRLAESNLKPSYRVKPTDKIEVNDASLKLPIEQIDLPVIYEDDNVIVINKSEGVLTHSKGAINEEATVASFIKPRISPEFVNNNRGGIVHRLDRATSGVLITAKNSATVSYLQKQFSSRKVKKTYAAIVDGELEQPEALIDVPIERNPKKPQTFKASSAGKPARTHYKLLKTIDRDNKTYSLLELSPETGRTHQIRVHMAYIGHPVTGDRVYGSGGYPHLYLHSTKLEITIPEGQRKVFKAPPPDYFKEF
jgi:23S rRNA pseudouridine1911/1915/1917 synthase